MAAGRAKGFAVSSSSVLLCEAMLDRTSLQFSCGAAAGGASVIVKDVDDADATNGFPVSQGQTVRIEGKACRHRWTAIRLAAVDCIVGVIEGFPDNYAVPPEPNGVPV